MFLKGKQMSLEQRARILQIAVSSTCGVRELVHLLRSKTSNVISLLRIMTEEQLIEMQPAKNTKKGKPKTCVKATSLGFEFLQDYKKLKNKPLKARKQDLNHATKDALNTLKIEENGLSPFNVFMELNAIASNIKNSSKTHRPV